MPRDRMWTTTEMDLTLVAATAGVASQTFGSLEASFTAASGRELRGVTVERTFIRGLGVQAGTATTPSLITWHLGLGVFTKAIDGGDFPNIALHDGDWYVHESYTYFEAASGVNPTPAGIRNAGVNVYVDSKGSRKVAKRDDVSFLLLQKADVSEDDLTVHFEVTTLWLLP